MLGLITGREVIRHGPTIVRHYGPRCYFRCMMALLTRQRTTFLEIAFRNTGAKSPCAASVPEARGPHAQA